MKTIKINQINKAILDLVKIREVAGNNNLSEEDIFNFGTFVIARSGVNRNHSDITSEGQKSAEKAWIGKAILYKDHESNVSNQIGRIYESWTEEENGETVTYGKGFGVRTDDHKDIFARIENGINKEMSCAYEPVKSVCSKCNADLTGDNLMTCPNGHIIGSEAYAMDLEFLPDHISFVSRPAVEGAGIVSHSQDKLLKVFSDLGETPEEASENLRVLKRNAEDGIEFRRWAEGEFLKWYSMSNPETKVNEAQALADKLTVREMITLGRIEKERFHEVMPTGKQMTETPPPQEEVKEYEEHEVSLREISQALRKDNNNVNNRF